jgi:phosphoglycolate phosphatase
MAAKGSFDLVILDYDGTLGDTRLAIAHCLERALMSQGRASSRERITDAVGRGLRLRETLAFLLPDLHEDGRDVEAIVSSYRALYRDESEPWIKPFAGAREALQRLHASGIVCAVVSNKGFGAVVRSLDRHRMSPFVERIFAERPGLPTKPDPALLSEHILQRHPPVAKERVLMVGDTDVDITFARRAGIASCWAAYGFGDRECCLALSPTYVIETIEALPAVVGLGDGHG